MFTTFFRLSRASNSKVSGLIRPEFEFIQDFMPVLVTCKFDEYPIKKWMHYRFHNSFSNISLWGIFSEDPIENEGVRPVTTFFPIVRENYLVAMATRVLIQSAPKHYAAFPPPQWCYNKIWSRLANWPQRYSTLKVWTTCQQSRACTSKVNSAMWPTFQLVEYFIPVQFICKFHKD